MSRPAVISLSLVESIDTYGDWFADAADGPAYPAAASPGAS